MIAHLKHLAELRAQIEAAGMIEKARLAGRAADLSFELARIMAGRILHLEQELAQWKQQQHPTK